MSDPASIRIKATSPSFSKNAILSAELLSHFPNAVLNTSGTRYAGAQLAEYIGDADGVVVGLEHVDAKLLDACPDLKIVAKYGVGMDNIDTEECKRRNIAIGWTGGVNRLSVAEMTLGFMLALSRNLYATSLQLKTGFWNKSGGRQLSGKTIGIIGVGNIGKELIRLLTPFNCELLVNDIVDQRNYYSQIGAKEAAKEDIYGAADCISIHTPLTGETRNLINERSLAMMQPHTFVINTARGGIVAETDLKRALEAGTIAGAALDVYDEEPPTDEEFLRLPNLFCTPHIGGNAYEAVVAMGRSAIGHLKEFFRP